MSISSGGAYSPYTLFWNSNHACGLRADGVAICWGDYREGQTSPPEGERFTSISSGGLQTCGLREDGIAVCWGPTFWLPEHERFTSISSGGGRFSCGLRNDGFVICWEQYEIDGVFFPQENGRFTSISSGSAQTCGLQAGIPHMGSLQAQWAIQTRWWHHSQVLQGQSIAGLSNKGCDSRREPCFLSVFVVFWPPPVG